MLPSPSSSPSRPAFIDRTNIIHASASKSIQPTLSFSLPTPPKHEKSKRGPPTCDGPQKKRVKLSYKNDKRRDSGVGESDTDSDAEVEDRATTLHRARRHAIPCVISDRVMSLHTGFSQVSLSTRPILQTFVSSNKSDVYKCEPRESYFTLTVPYACSYSHAAKNGGESVLAVATEQGSVHIINTSKRNDWDPEPPRTTYQPHANGIFDIKWNISDTLIATSSGDQSTRISCPRSSIAINALRGHTHSVKCVTWDPHHNDLLCTSGRDGAICVWDLRAGEERQLDAGNGPEILSPVVVIPGAHEEFVKGNIKARSRKPKTTSSRSVTSLLYPEQEPFQVISSSSADGILKCWDLRQVSSSKKRKTPVMLYASDADPTTFHDSRRARGITHITSGSGPTAGLLFALGADSRVHTYTLPTLSPQNTSFMHKNMQTNSFYVRAAISPCGKWLASGGNAPDANVFLFDVSNAARPCWSMPTAGVELSGQLGEVGAVDWAEGMLATCADDGTVRIWRPDIEIYRDCQMQPEEKKWDWCWSTRG